MRIVGALNNDMIGWANDHRLDNTIRYSNAGDPRRAARGLVPDEADHYDARYFKSTDAASYYEAYGDIVGGIGSYPVLGNPHYHQPTDLLETVNHELVAETSKVTVASIMLLASSPSRVKDLKVAGPAGGPVSVTWAASPEKSVNGLCRRVGPRGRAAAEHDAGHQARGDHRGRGAGDGGVGQGRQRPRPRRVGLGEGGSQIGERG